MTVQLIPTKLCGEMRITYFDKHIL
ncbi:Uncharacterized protein APZ42_020674 [Daphnia magna]|uniref:Uncharacterized protein n=1 Tax=Daphnia magna TaxID=35525 RepID=A0A164XAZ7_9CRUS|nr:Uncharacterized protein APZ42_020674 [Daphnia magna]